MLGDIVVARCDNERRFFSARSPCGNSKFAIEFRRLEASGCGEAAAIAGVGGGVEPMAVVGEIAVIPGNERRGGDCEGGAV